MNLNNFNRKIIQIIQITGEGLLIITLHALFELNFLAQIEFVHKLFQAEAEKPVADDLMAICPFLINFSGVSRGVLKFHCEIQENAL